MKGTSLLTAPFGASSTLLRFWPNRHREGGKCTSSAGHIAPLNKIGVLLMQHGDLVVLEPIETSQLLKKEIMVQLGKFVQVAM